MSSCRKQIQDGPMSLVEYERTQAGLYHKSQNMVSRHEKSNANTGFLDETLVLYMK
jgi:hypothetical protein